MWKHKWCSPLYFSPSKEEVYVINTSRKLKRGFSIKNLFNPQGLCCLALWERSHWHDEGYIYNHKRICFIFSSMHWTIDRSYLIFILSCKYVLHLIPSLGLGHESLFEVCILYNVKARLKFWVQVLSIIINKHCVHVKLLDQKLNLPAWCVCERVWTHNLNEYIKFISNSLNF